MGSPNNLTLEVLERTRALLLFGLSVHVVETWETGYAWRSYRQGPVPPRGVRKGTRRQWKRAHPQGLRWRMGPVEPGAMLRTGDTLYCTQRQYYAIKQQLAASGGGDG